MESFSLRHPIPLLLSNSCSTACSYCCLAQICVMTIRSSPVDLTNPDIYSREQARICIKMFYTSCGLCSCGAEPPISGLAFKIMATKLSRCGCRSPSAVILPIFSKCGAFDVSVVALRLLCVIDEKNVVLSYEGLDGLARSATLSDFDPPPTRTYRQRCVLRDRSWSPGSGNRCSRPSAAMAQEQRRLLLSCRDSSRRLAQAKDVSANTATVETSNDLFNQILCRSMADLRMLTTETAQGPLSLCGHTVVFDDLWP